MAKLILLRGTIGSGKTSVSKELKRICPETELIEIDDIKLEKYGTTIKCDPIVDFREAGERAGPLLSWGLNVVVVEPLCEKDHYRYVLEAANKAEDSTDVIPVWLECSMPIAIKRKSKDLSENIIRCQFCRYTNRYRPKNELIIDTESKSIGRVAKQIYDSF